MTTTVNSFILCPSCGCRVRSDAAHCGRCGVSIVSAPCSRCGHQNILTSAICIQCHSDLRIKKCPDCGTANIPAAAICSKCRCDFGGNHRAKTIAGGEGYIWALIVLLVSVTIFFMFAILASTYPDAKAFSILAAITGGIALPASLSIAFAENLVVSGVRRRTCLLVFVSAATLGTLAALILYALVPITAIGVGVVLVLPVIVGATEELAKIASIAWWLKPGKYEGQAIGLGFGVIAGLGFGALENIVYVLASNGGGNVLVFGKAMLTRSLVCLLHAVWTGALASVVWRDRRVSLQLTAGVVGTYVIVAVMHALWNIGLVRGVASETSLAVMIVSGICSAAFFIFRLRYVSLQKNSREDSNQSTCR